MIARAELTDAAGIAALRERWSSSPRGIRVTDLIDAGEAQSLLDSLRVQHHALMAASSINISYQYRAFAMVPDSDCDHVVCRFGRWLFGDARAWLSQITGMELDPPPDRQLVATLYGKGAYLALHNDYDSKRKLAFIYGLTPPGAPLAEPDGHLDLLTDDESGVALVERRPPGWNTLDIFDVTKMVQWHRVNMVRTHAERRAISGWFY